MVDSAPDFIPLPETDEALLEQCRVETFRAGGKGGQHQNTTDSGVRLIHLPSGFVVTARRNRSQHRNKVEALARLRARIEEANRPRPERKATRVPRSEKTRRLEAKRRQGKAKELRKRPNSEEDP